MPAKPKPTPSRSKNASPKVERRPPASIFEEVGPVIEVPASEKEARDRMRALAAVAASMRDVQPVSSILRRVRAVPTCFPQFDHATRVGGLPIERVTTIHGPSSHGKTLFAAGLGMSFLRNFHFFRLADAERTTPITWLDQLWTPGLIDLPTFSATRPKTYEDCVSETREWATAIGEAKAKGRLPKETSGLLVVDSLRKLVPKGFFEKTAKAVEEVGVDGYGGRGAQIKAQYNASWLDELVVLMEQTGTAVVFITRESEEMVGAGRFAHKEVQVKGGMAIIYDASMRIRILREKWMTEGGSATERGTVVGERHVVEIHKSKVAGKDDKIVKARFHSSNGVVAEVPAGFDLASDVIELATNLGLVKKSGSWLQWGKSRWQGVDAAKRALSRDRSKLAELEAACRSKFGDVAPEEESGVVVDDDGVVFEKEMSQ